MKTLVLVEHDNHNLHSATLSALGAAKQIGGLVHLLVVGYHCQSVVEQAAITAGVNLVFVVDKPEYEHVLAEHWAPIVVQLASTYQAILAPATTFGKNILPRVAASLKVAQISDVTAILDKDIFEHPIYAGNAVQRIQSLDSIKLLTIRTTAFDPVLGKQSPCTIEKIETNFVKYQTQFVSHQLNQSTRPELS